MSNLKKLHIMYQSSSASLYKEVTLQYLPEFNAFGIADEVVEQITAEGKTPLISLSAGDYVNLGETPRLSDQPVVSYLLGREKGYFTIDYNYALAVARSGADIRFLTYKENLAQMDGTCGLILPGGAFDSPDEFYTDPLNKCGNAPGARSYAYITSIMQAEAVGMPILGICAGAQMVGGMHGMKMYRNIKKYTATAIEHKNPARIAHPVYIYPDTPLAEIMGAGYTDTNSRHNEGMLPNEHISDLQIYASAPDGIPEAWGSKEKHLLCIQWHPEHFAAEGDKKMQGIYDWLAEEAYVYQCTR